jgi:alpha-pyrone synthase
MSSIIAISTSVPGFSAEKEDFLEFYMKALQPADPSSFSHKLNFLNRKTKIEKRYSCLPDFKGTEMELFKNENYIPAIEERMELYGKKIIPLATDAIDKLFFDTKLRPSDVTHLITVSCTGLRAPGIEFQLAEYYGLRHAEKTGLNFLGCYAAIKALKQAHYIAQADPKACVLIICAELCSIHFYPSDVDEDIVANLLFADGASAAMVMGDENAYVKDKIVLKLNDLGSACIPNTFNLMTWNIGPSNFKMHLSKHIAGTIRENILPVVSDFLKEQISSIDFWAIHPGGVKIVEAVRDKLNLSESNVEDSMNVLKNYGNMSSPTILFILSSIFNKIKNDPSHEPKNIFSCAFGPGINIEMIRLSSVNNALVNNSFHLATGHAFEV